MTKDKPFDLLLIEVVLVLLVIILSLLLVIMLAVTYHVLLTGGLP